MTSKQSKEKVLSSIVSTIALAVTFATIPVNSSCPSGDVRLHGGDVVYEGQVEVCFNNRWGAVCHFNWDDKDAVVVCRQLGYLGGTSFKNSYFGHSTGLIHFDHVQCSGSEPNLLNCPRRSYLSYSCGHSRTAGVRCSSEMAGNCSHGSVHLVGGDVDREGQVEVCLNNRWGAVCHYDWDTKDAVVVCKELGYASGAAITGAYFGHSTGLIHMDRVRCSGYESSLLNCQRGANLNYLCHHSRTAGVRCSSEIAHNCGHGDIRLVDGEVDYEGRVEMCYNNIWGTVCHDNWDYRDAVVVCHQLGYSGGVAIRDAYYGDGTGLILLDEVRCSGLESKLLDCVHNGIGVLSFCDHSQDAGVYCSGAPAENCSNGDVRLVDGHDEYEGRVEMCYNNRWGTVCHDNWGYRDAVVVCHQHGYSGGVAIGNAYYGYGTGLILLDEVRCSGLESKLLDCVHNGIGVLSFCDHSQDAGVRCLSLPAGKCSNGDVRLVGGRDRYEGRVEMCYNNRWGTVCHDSWDYKDAVVVCNQLGYSGGAAYYNSYFGRGSGYIMLDEVRCTGFESILMNCSHSGIGTISFCDHSKDAGVRCSSLPAEECSNGRLRLVNGNVAHEGRIEMCYGKRWGTVCHDFWGNSDASVVCRQLGYSGGSYFTNAYFGQGSGLILLDDVRCSGSESNLLSCPHNGIGVITFCDHSEDAGVRCSI